MAQDAHDLRFPSGSESGQTFDGRLNIPLAADWVRGQPSEHSHSAPNSEARSVEPFRSTITDLSVSASRSPDGSTAGDIGSYGERMRIRTLPAWIRSVEQNDDEPEASVTDRLLPSEPGDAHVAQHNHSPYATSKAQYDGSSKMEEGLGAERATSPRRESRWKNFSKGIAYPHEQGLEEKLVTSDWLNENYGDYSGPWRGGHQDCEDSDDPLKKRRRRKIWFRRFHTTLLKSPIVPLIFRLTVWFFSLVALALGASIQHLAKEFEHPQGPSALMAIVVDAVALVYLIYITVDEFTSKPLGLRSASAKARLILLDIIFIVFDSANLSLAFESLSSVQGACTVATINEEVVPKNDGICDRQKALASVLLVALIAWLLTFSISVLRLVERVAH